FFINDIDNSTALDPSNGGGYAVFGKVLGNGMQVVDTIAALSTIQADPTNVNSHFNQLPLGSNNQLARINSITLDSIDGTVFADANRNGQLDQGESGVAGRTVFLNNDGTGEPDANNPSTVTDANGNYSFTGVAPGLHMVAEVTPPGVIATTPMQVVTVTAGSTTSNVDLGEFSPLAIRGTVFDDVNVNGRQDAGEDGLAGITVFVDVDGTGVPDASNPSTTTDANGAFSFNGLAPGAYTVGQVLPSLGVTATTPSVTVTVTNGQVATADFGDVLTSTILPLFVGGTNAAQSSGADTSFVNAVYVNVLDRTAEATGLAYWQQQLGAGVPRSQVVLQIWDSVEHRELEIGEYYHEFLNRSADASGMAHWLALFAALGEKGEVDAFVSSPEYSQEHSSDADFVDALYHDIALRPADNAGLSYWQGQLAAGMTRAELASIFVNSPDATTRLVDELYSVLLQREPDSADKQSWVSKLEGNSLTVEQAGITFLSSDEYFALMR
ncbi:MAG TPA: DUF4214 domain-containing protein, partial [Pirellulales bacterium]|nr:DUF4214 domain-containing protein [Pirellulales bacterium]